MTQALKPRLFDSVIQNLRLEKPRPFSSNPESGMTIIEILIVIALIGSIMTLLIGNFLGRAERAKEELTATAQINLKQSLSLYKLNVNRFPSTEEGLKALIEAPANAKGWRGPYTEDDKIRDAFGVDMQYELLSPAKFKITSAGIDGEFNTPDDIVFPKEARDEAPVSTELTVPAGQNQVP